MFGRHEKLLPSLKRIVGSDRSTGNDPEVAVARELLETRPCLHTVRLHSAESSKQRGKV